MTHLHQVMLEELQRRNYATTTITTASRPSSDWPSISHRLPDYLNHTRLHEYQANSSRCG